MTQTYPRSALALAGVALAVAIVVSALAATRSSGSGGAIPPSAATPGGGWYAALAGTAPRGSPLAGSACGVRLSAATVGVVHPILPCGTRLVLSYGDRALAARVVGRGPLLPGRDFSVTSALAQRLGLAGVQQVRWRFAKPPGA